MLWALNDAPVVDPTRKLVLIALADGANDDGSGTCPGHKLMARRACVDVKTVKRHLKALEELGLIRRGDQRIAEKYRADRRPVVWDLDLAQTQELADVDVTHRLVPTRRPHNVRNQWTVAEDEQSAPAADVAAATRAYAEPRGDIVSPRENPQVSASTPTGGHHVPPHGGTYGGTYGGASMSYESRQEPGEPEEEGGALAPASRPVDKDPVLDPLKRALAAAGISVSWARFTPRQRLETADALGRCGVPALVDFALRQNAVAKLPAAFAAAFVPGWKGLAPVPEPAAAAAAPSLPPWCGECGSPDPSQRFREDDEGRPYRCPACHPSTVAAF